MCGINSEEEEKEKNMISVLDRKNRPALDANLQRELKVNINLYANPSFFWVNSSVMLISASFHAAFLLVD